MSSLIGISFPVPDLRNSRLLRSSVLGSTGDFAKEGRYVCRLRQDQGERWRIQRAHCVLRKTPTATKDAISRSKVVFPVSRIDHFLGKETANNMLVSFVSRFRMGTTLDENHLVAFTHPLELKAETVASTR